MNAPLKIALINEQYFYEYRQLISNYAKLFDG
jgi:hypothetical protein